MDRQRVPKIDPNIAQFPLQGPRNGDVQFLEALIPIATIESQLSFSFHVDSAVLG